MEAKQIKVRTLALSVIAVIFVEAGLVFSRGFLNPLFGLGVARLLEFGLMVGVVRTVQGNGTSMGLGGQRWMNSLKRGLLWSAGFGALSGIVFAILLLSGTNPLSLIKTSLPGDLPNLILFFVVGGIAAPVAEELFFRGILYGFLRRWGVWVAVVFSTCAFALVHGLGHGFPVTQVVGGILFAVAYEIEKNLLVPITIHCLGNLAIFSLSLLS